MVIYSYPKGTARKKKILIYQGFYGFYPQIMYYVF